MSQDEVPESRVVEINLSLFLILRNNDVECGYLRQEGGHNEWRSVAKSAVPTSSDRESLLDLSEALQKIIPHEEVGNKKWREIHVTASERWVQSLSIPWSQALLRLGTEQAFLREQFHASGVALTAADVLQVGEGPQGQPRLAVLYPDPFIQTLRKWSSQLGGALASVQPLYLAGWAMSQQLATKDAPREGPSPLRWRLLALVDKDSVCLVYGPAGVFRSHGVIEGISHRYVDLNPGGSSGVQMAWKRFVLRNPHLGGVDELPMLDLSKRDLSFMRNDGTQKPVNTLLSVGTESFIQAAVSMKGHSLTLEDVAPGWKPAHMLILLALLLLVLVAVIRIGVGVSEHRGLSAKISEAQRNTAGLQTTKTWSKEEVKRIQSMNRAIRDLNVPVDALLEAIIPPKDIKVAVLGMETVGKTLSASSMTSSIKLLGQACSTADMARYVAFVSDRKPFTGASLLRHEFSEKLGRCPYKFTVEAKWSD